MGCIAVVFGISRDGLEIAGRFAYFNARSNLLFSDN